jgi:mannose/cellobiose epimerase-like protein (N-acyl-D-glucosamine 2-epimerase family)
VNPAINFRSREFLLGHIRHSLSFYENRCVDPGGGFFHCYMKDGTIFDPGLRTLVASCRFVFVFAKAYREFGAPHYLDKVRHGVAYLRQAHLSPRSGGYAWRIDKGAVIDSTNHCYGLAFVMLAYACAVEAGIGEAKDWIYETFETMEARFWLADHGRYASEADADWKLSSYRGQNDNMHACEAMIAAYEATGDQAFLDRACLLAEKFAHTTPGPIWEHYTTDWRLDLEYNRGNTTNHMRPWGVQTGHQTEWSKLLLILDRHRPEAWRLPRAIDLFDPAMRYGWDEQCGGLIYGYDLEGRPYDFDKYFWVQAESLAAAALLGDRAGETYWGWYERIWSYSFEHFVDHEYGAWYRILTRQNVRYDDRKSYNNKTDYHTMGACYEALNVIKN